MNALDVILSEENRSEPYIKTKKPLYRWKPPDTVDSIETDLGVVYLCSDCSAIAYAGKSEKKSWYFKFRTEEQRRAKIAEFFNNLKEHKEKMVQRKSERSKPHTLKVGDILYSSWGYDQTNVEFFQVLSVTAHTADIQEIAQEAKETGFMQGHCSAVKDRFIGEIMRNKRVHGDNTMHIDSVRYLWPWDGREKRWSSYA